MISSRAELGTRGDQSGRPGATFADVWLLTGGAGYIGSHVSREFARHGIEHVVLDDLSTGFRHYVPDGVPFVDGSAADPSVVDGVFSRFPIRGVMHVAGLKYAGQSVLEPMRFYDANYASTRVLIEAVGSVGVDRFVLSSSCSWYGTPDQEMVTEVSPAKPESPYGQSKVMSEWVLRAVARTRPELRQVSLRYFNVVGSGDSSLIDHSPYNLFPRVFRALSEGTRPTVFGADYPTPDGTCIRDYVHVQDVAAAHVLLASVLDDGPAPSEVYNVGTGRGESVLDVITEIAAHARLPVDPEVLPRRAGDPARIVGSAQRLRDELGWTAQHDLASMVSTAWDAWTHGRGSEYSAPGPTAGGIRCSVGTPPMTSIRDLNPPARTRPEPRSAL